jgi:DNA mismatch repair ATPase MutS
MAISQKLITHYKELKRQAPDCLLLMQVGAFMQVMNEDAQSVSDVTGIKLQMAGDVNAPVITGGFPKSGINKYLGQLARAGHSVAIAWQDEDKQRHIEEIIRVQLEKQPKDVSSLNSVEKKT